MTPQRTRIWRRTAGWLGALILSLIVLCVLDGLVSQARREYNAFDALPGQRVKATGPFPAGAGDLAAVIIDGNNETVRLRFEDSTKSFWFGGSLWRGVIEVGAQAAAGRYRLALRGPEEPVAKPNMEYTVRVFASPEEMRSHSTSYAIRFLDLHPFALAGSLFPFALLVMAGSFFLSKHMEQAMAKEGKAEIYMVKKSPEGCLVSFSLGTTHGIRPGDRMDILNENGLKVAQADVEQSGKRDSVAKVLAPVQIEVGFVVAKEGAQP
jgi:hypothetical protein